MENQKLAVEIVFSNTNGTFLAGGHLNGHLVVKLAMPMKLKGIQAKAEGTARMQSSSESSPVLGIEKCLYKKLCLFGDDLRGAGVETTELPAGRHIFPFHQSLPQCTPSSYEDSIVEIRYRVVCKISRLNGTAYRKEREFIVKNGSDLESRTRIASRRRKPVVRNKQKMMRRFLRKSGLLSAQFMIDRKNWQSGEMILLHADINNESDCTIRKSHVTLVQTTVYQVGNKNRLKSREIARETRSFIGAQSTDQWAGEELLIPPTTPSSLAGCKIIDVTYTLQLTIQPSGLANDLVVRLPITICLDQEDSVCTESPSSDFSSRLPLAKLRAGSRHSFNGQRGAVSPACIAADCIYYDPPPSYRESVSDMEEAELEAWLTTPYDSSLGIVSELSLCSEGFSSYSKDERE